MISNLLVISAVPFGGKSAVIIGLMDLLERYFAKVGYFKPISDMEDIELIHGLFSLDVPQEQLRALTSGDLQELVARGKYDDILEKIISAYQNIEKKFDFMVTEGIDYLPETSAIEFDLSCDISKNINAPILLVTSADDKEAIDVANQIKLYYEEFKFAKCDFFGVVVTKVAPKTREQFQKQLVGNLPKEIELIGLIPQNPVLQNPGIDEIAEAIGAESLMGQDDLASYSKSQTIRKTHIGAMALNNFLGRVTNHSLVITPGDRDEIILGALLAHLSPSMPHVAALILTGGYEPKENVRKLIEETMPTVKIPILKVPDNTYTTAIKVNDVKAKITPKNTMRIEVLKSLVGASIDVSKLLSLTSSTQIKQMTPKRFIHHIQDEARKAKKSIVLPEGEEPRIIEAADIIRTKNIAELILLGNEEKITQTMSRCGCSRLADDVTIIDPQTDVSLVEYTATYSELRTHKDIPPAVAADIMKDPQFFGTMMVWKGAADGMVSGSITSTRHTLRPAFQFVKTAEGYSIVSSIFFMCLPDQVLVYGDCAVNTNPTAEQLAEIAMASAETAEAFGIEPVVAMLSYSTGASGAGVDVDAVKEATEIVLAKNPPFPVEGPIQYDAAIDPNVGKVKLPDSLVAGKATVFVFPDLNSGNNTYKAVQRSSGAIAIGPIMQGLKKPVNDLSRGCTVPDIVNTVTITAIQAARS